MRERADGHCHQVDDEMRRRVAVFLGGTAVTCTPPAELAQYVDSCMRVTGPSSEARQRLLVLLELSASVAAVPDPFACEEGALTDALVHRYGVGDTEPDYE